jgi:nucleotide-binding universal stress UspA family protein
MIVAGRRGYGTLRGMLVGSVSQKLIAHATCPVLIT